MVWSLLVASGADLAQLGQLGAGLSLAFLALLFAALVARLPAAELIENVRQNQAWERTALTELRQGSVSRAVAMYNRRGKINVAATDDDTIDQAVDAWYRDVEEVGDPAEVLLIGHRNTTVHELNQRARALVAEAGLLRGPTVNAHGRDFRTGDRVVCLKNRSRLGVLNGDLATITGVETNRRTVTIRVDRDGRSVSVPHWYLDDGHLDWGYALTGHKAQGATAQRAHTVAAGDGVDREWIYVTMSRGWEANTIYLTDPYMSQEECEHLAHQHLDRLPALIAALGRTATEPAAVDARRGPGTSTDEELAQRLAQVADRLRDYSPAMGEAGDHAEELSEYVVLRCETEARHNDRLAAIQYQPPDWVVDAIGERPSESEHRTAWDQLVDRAVRYRSEHRISDEVGGLLGSEPTSSGVERRVAWIAARSELQRHFRKLGTGFQRPELSCRAVLGRGARGETTRNRFLSVSIGSLIRRRAETYATVIYAALWATESGALPRHGWRKG